MNETKTNPTVNYFLDTEFYEDGKTIELISICLVSEFGECIYMENAEFDWSTVPSGHWLRVNVKPSLKEIPEVLFTKQAIAERIIKFVDTESVNPLFWGYYSDYDWVVLCQLFGTMVQLPKGFPMFCLDLKQSLHERFLGKGAEIPEMDIAFIESMDGEGPQGAKGVGEAPSICMAAAAANAIANAP